MVYWLFLSQPSILCCKIRIRDYRPLSFFNELKRRNVFKVAAAYIIVSWLLLQVSDTLIPALHLPEWFHSGVAFVLIIVNNWRYPIPNPKLPPQPDFMDNFYYKPYVRASAYLMGIFTGFIYVEFKAGNEAFTNPINRIKNSVPIRVAFYIIGIILVEGAIWIIVPYQKGAEWSSLAQAFYNSLNRYLSFNSEFSS